MNVRSWLCASTLNDKLVAKAEQVGADVVHWDLEDSVASIDKVRARTKLLASERCTTGRSTAVRINALSSRHGLEDVLALLKHAPPLDIVIVPKVKELRDVELVCELLSPTLASLQVFAVIETVAGFRALRGLRSVPERLAGFIFGAADFAADLGVDRSTAKFLPIKQEIQLTARQFGLVAIDSPCFELRSEARLREELDEARCLGFSGKIAIHPSQVPAINQAFTPSPSAQAQALALLEARRVASPGTIMELEQQMVGPPFVRRAEEVLADAKRFALRTPAGKT